jgi:cysteine-rich repeat protein
VCEETEACDDGNPDDGDGCSSTCIIEDGWDCTGEPSVCMPSGIPTVSEWGMVVMTLLVLTAGTLVLAGRRRLTT